MTSAISTVPTGAHLLDGCSSRLRTYVFFWIGCTVGFTEGVTTSDQGNGFLVVHRHTAKRFADGFCCQKWVSHLVWTFWIDIDQAHFGSS